VNLLQWPTAGLARLDNLADQLTDQLTDPLGDTLGSAALAIASPDGVISPAAALQLAAQALAHQAVATVAPWATALQPPPAGPSPSPATARERGAPVPTDPPHPGSAPLAAGQDLGEAARLGGDDLRDVFGQLWDTLGDAVGEVADAAGDAFEDMGEGSRLATQGFFGNLERGHVGGAYASVVRGVDRAVFQSTERVLLGRVYAAGDLLHGLTDLLGPLGVPARALGDRVLDHAYTLVDTATTNLRTAFRLVPDMLTGLVTDYERAVELAVQGRWGAAIGQMGRAGANLAIAPGMAAIDIGLTTLQASVSLVQTGLFLEPPGRRLTAAEIAQLRPIYGHSLDYDTIRVKTGGPLNNLMRAHVVGNTIYLPSNLARPDGRLNAQGIATLAHEVGHVWQNQNGGADYLHRALGAQLWAWLNGSAPQAYDWTLERARGDSFESMNPEAQADLLMDLQLALADGRITTADSATMAQRNLTPQEVRFMRQVARELGWGMGAG
jgi:hypothetical protein